MLLQCSMFTLEQVPILVIPTTKLKAQTLVQAPPLAIAYFPGNELNGAASEADACLCRAGSPMERSR